MLDLRPQSPAASPAPDATCDPAADRAPGHARARAWYVGARIDQRAFERSRESVAGAPSPLIPCGPGGWLAPARFGVAVCIGLTPSVEREALAELEGFVAEPVSPWLGDDIDIVVHPDGDERVLPDGRLQLRRDEPARLAVVAQALAKSALLAHHEQQVAAAFDRVEELAETLSRGRWSRGTRHLMAEIGQVLAVQVRTLGRAEVGDKPELTWDQPELDRLYERLATEFELHERDHALNRKLDLVSGAAQTQIELLHSRQGLRLEWAIVLLIVLEIVLGLWPS